MLIPFKLDLFDLTASLWPSQIKLLTQRKIATLCNSFLLTWKMLFGPIRFGPVVQKKSWKVLVRCDRYSILITWSMIVIVNAGNTRETEWHTRHSKARRLRILVSYIWNGGTLSKVDLSYQIIFCSSYTLFIKRAFDCWEACSIASQASLSDWHFSDPWWRYLRHQLVL